MRLNDMFNGGYVGGEELVGLQQGQAPMRSQWGVPGRQQPMVQQQVTPKIRRTLIGIDSVATVAAAATVAIQNSPQTIFRPERLIVGSLSGPAFVIADIKVGNLSQFPSAQAVPAESFSAAATDAQLAYDTCQVGQQVTVTVTNISGGAVRFTAGFFGSIATA